jgi:hypothetical protein
MYAVHDQESASSVKALPVYIQLGLQVAQT